MNIEVAFTFIRRIVTFGLGVWVIINALAHPDERISQLIVGMIMVGVLPIENLFSWFHRLDPPPPPPPTNSIQPKE